MGILNITPDSFSDGGQLFRNHRPDLERIIQRAESLAAEGADLLDVGGESTRPGAASVGVEHELARVIPAITALAARIAVPISVDTSTPEVMAASAQAGAAMINDVRALRRPGALAAAALAGLPVCLMHMRGEPARMQDDPVYDDVVAEVMAFLHERIAVCEQAGIDRRRLLLDPGFGFGKTLGHNLQLFGALPRFAALGAPLMVGLSRKSIVGAVLGRPLGERLQGSVALALLAVQKGARILRVHDVAATVDALKILAAVDGVSD
jgi:dihydropteroate synthase